MANTIQKHLSAISSGTIGRSTVIGVRKALNMRERKLAGYQVSRTALKASPANVDELEAAIASHQPRADTELHASGLKVLTNRRYAKRLAPVADTIAELDHFELAGFLQPNGHTYTPAWRGVGKSGEHFTFINVPWQSGGDGPELIR